MIFDFYFFFVDIKPQTVGMQNRWIWLMPSGSVFDPSTTSYHGKGVNLLLLLKPFELKCIKCATTTRDREQKTFSRNWNKSVFLRVSASYIFLCIQPKKKLAIWINLMLISIIERKKWKHHTTYLITPVVCDGEIVINGAKRSVNLA